MTRKELILLSVLVVVVVVMNYVTIEMDETYEVMHVLCVAVCVMLYRSKELIYLVWLDCVLWMFGRVVV